MKTIQKPTFLASIKSSYQLYSMICFALDTEIFQVFLVNLPNLKVQDTIAATAANGESTGIEDEIIIGKCDIPEGVAGNFAFSDNI